MSQPADTTPDQVDTAADGSAGPMRPDSALRRMMRPASVLHSRGPESFINLNLYSLGLTGLWTAVGSVILPLMVSDMIARGPIQFMGFEFQKNGAISIIAIAGGVVVGITQPLAGWLSDRTSGPLGKRLPYIAVGTIGLIPITMILGGMSAFLPLILIFVGIQFFGNLAQGPANALLRDHVPASRFGAASGSLILTRAAGAGLVVAAVLGLMSNYDAVDNPQWLWASLAVVSGVVILTVSWTFTSLRARHAVREPGQPSFSISRPEVSEPGSGAGIPQVRGRGFGLFLVALTVIVAGMSSMSIYAVFYMEDMVAPANPTEGLLLVVAILLPTVGLTVLPAGRLSDRIGRERTLIGAGLLGAFGVLLLALVPRLPIVLVAAVPIGVSCAAFFTVLWALANDLVTPGFAARDLGFTGIAFLVGGVVARFAGFAVDALNGQSANLGYRALLFVIAAAFVLMPVVLRRLSPR